MAQPTSNSLCKCLQRITGLMEKGEAVEAAGAVAEMNELLPLLPLEMTTDELAEANRLLKRCVELEAGMRQKVLASLQRLAATRKSLVYRRYGGRP
jgi:hypothetical protein